MDPFTIALATFGVQKLRGQSTKRALRDAALVGGGSQLFGMATSGGSGVTPFGGEKGISSLRDTTAAQLAGFKGSTPTYTGTEVPFGDLPESQFAAGDGITSYADEEVRSTFKEIPIKQAKDEGSISNEVYKRLRKEGVKTTSVLQDTFVTGDRDYSNLRAERIKDLSEKVTDTASKEGIAANLFKKAKDNKFQTAILASSVLPLLSEEEEGDGQLEGYTKEDYDKAYAEQADKLEGAFVPATNARPTMDETIRSDMFYANEGGLATIIPKFNKGGVNYLPSKSDHDENDYSNYVRAEGYVEDGAGNGDKDEDTMLAQLADGEFVSRADAVLGAGILSGGDPKSYKSMRKAGASYFYDQQKKLKRIYDLVNENKSSSVQ